ncbi:Isoleucyl-tRNA synthetase [Thermodesulfobium acidiphilum]|uniref:Isoleucine--tRNA ligase n=1 Tax=Thermodesulfobium acidiphilum TaxID=1794699 RepID=A0A2R4W0Y6_THEAF|nr:isoleucine--tRNA ligase [Thermodesulfobium acidiphilum]AWB10402.1 Isoleucyl-tRNA synthetase [Thermodesulfobium acidiphilum]
MVEYKKTLKLPKTNFPMQARLTQREPELLKKWQKENVFEKAIKLRADNEFFLLHDGPPYANGDIHLGTAFNKILKDMINKYYMIKGKYTPYVPGWDCHGLPIEFQALKTLGKNKKEFTVTDIRKMCQEHALKFIDRQRKQFIRLGVFGYWDKPYITMDPKYEAMQIRIFWEMYKKGYIYKGLKPVFWCPSCETALAEAEVEYYDTISPSIFVKFPVFDGRGVLERGDMILIWTTTPWTLISNKGLAVKPDSLYDLIQFQNERILVAKERLKALEGILSTYKVIKTVRGEDLEGIIASNPLFPEKKSIVVTAVFVSMEDGSGIVHVAPGHGPEDYIVGVQKNLEVESLLNDQGVFTKEAQRFEGLFVHDASKAVIEDLERNGLLLFKSEVEHSYPHCWRCKGKLIYRATEQWFASVDAFREEALRATREVRWIPESGLERMSAMISNRADWCISRQRSWGLPIPAFYCEECNVTIVNDETINKVCDMFSKEGSDSWFKKDASQILGDYKCPSCGGKYFRKETDIMDVWFDSGSSHACVLKQREELRWPADMYLEGTDQHRGWFQSSLLTSTAVFGKAPYRSVLTHGFIVDEEGYKMSKSRGNVIAPLEVIEKSGADILRIWVASSDYTGDVAISGRILEQQSDTYRKLRNTIRYMLSLLNDFNPKDSMPPDRWLILDRYIYSEFNDLIQEIDQYFYNYQFYKMLYKVKSFMTIDLSAFYLDVLKDRLYAGFDSERKSAQTVIYRMLKDLLIILCPIISFTSEEAWEYLREIDNTLPESVFFASYPDVLKNLEGVERPVDFDVLLEIRDETKKVLEEARKDKLIGSSLEAHVNIFPKNEKLKDTLLKYKDILPEILIVSQVTIDKMSNSKFSFENDDFGIEVFHAKGEKCERCWQYQESVATSELKICDRCRRVLDELSN